MLHILNKAWAKILAQRVNDRIMFVYTTLQEQDMLIETFNEVEKEIGDSCLMWVTNENEIKEMMDNGIDIEMQDDILISHKIHDMMLKDYLGRHCKRRCC